MNSNSHPRLTARTINPSDNSDYSPQASRRTVTTPVKYIVWGALFFLVFGTLVGHFLAKPKPDATAEFGVERANLSYRK